VERETGIEPATTCDDASLALTYARVRYGGAGSWTTGIIENDWTYDHDPPATVPPIIAACGGSEPSFSSPDAPSGAGGQRAPCGAG